MDETRAVPFVDLPAQIAIVRAEIEKRFAQIIDTTSFVLREHCQRFEDEFSRYLGTGHAIGVGNGTDALVLALRAIGLRPGDEVITAANSFIATAEAVVLAGGRPVLVDVDERTYNIDPARVYEALTPRTRAIIPVHLYGQPAPMRPLLDLARDRGLAVIEDAAQAHGARYDGRRVGALGTLGCFSFYPTKNLGAFGDAGGVVTDDEELAVRVRKLRDHGGLTADAHDIVGQNSRMDALQAAVLSVKLAYLDEWNDRRRHRAAHYAQRLAALADQVTTPHADGDHIYHIYVVRVPAPRRDPLLRYLRAHGIGAGVHYPGPIHRTGAFAHLSLDGQLPVAELLNNEMLSLPMHAELSESDIDYVCDHLAKGLDVA
ncbi:DegT/DnrJ/EryC1/StrS family aminotransferase [Micromonospora sp. NPDC005652]|uniref:DegT/DnrJ/EryC1/StrS family aminotransferase n=1 Tax=Micromonospora sp. NPDC005652 TaxID=3157046 RepID=UPI0033F9295C